MAESKSTDIPDKFSLSIERGEAGLWYVTGSLHPGLFIAHQDLGTALADVPACFCELRAAERERNADAE